MRIIRPMSNASHAPKRDISKNMNAEDYFCHLLNKGYKRELAKIFVGRRFTRSQADALDNMIK